MSTMNTQNTQSVKKPLAMRIAGFIWKAVKAFSRTSLGKIVIMFAGAALAGPWGAVVAGIAAMLAPKWGPRLANGLAHLARHFRKEGEADGHDHGAKAPRSPAVKSLPSAPAVARDEAPAPYCGECGSMHDHDARFCAECGTEREWIPSGDQRKAA
jgi:hypothetical protein